MKRIVLLFIMIFYTGSIYGACIGKRHVIGTGGSTELCVKKVEFKIKKEADAFEAKQRKYEQDLAEANKPPAPKQENVGAQSGNTGTFINLGGWAGDSSASRGESKKSHGVALAKHNFKFSWTAYVFPNMAQLDRQTVGKFYLPTSAGYEWFFTKRFGLGAEYQEYILSSTRNFDPITTNQDVRETVDIINADGTKGTADREVNRDIPYLFPGAINNVKYERLWYYITFNSELGFGSNWNGVVRFGSAIINKATIEYNDIDLSLEKNQYAVQPQTQEVTAGLPFFLDLSIEKWLEQIRLSAYIRFVEAENDTSSYLDFIRMGGTEIGFTASFGITPWGYL